MCIVCGVIEIILLSNNAYALLCVAGVIKFEAPRTHLLRWRKGNFILIN
jgi:hypothetical protein